MSGLLEACSRINAQERMLSQPPAKAAVTKLAEKLGEAGTGAEKPRAGKNYDEIAARIRGKILDKAPLEGKEVRDSGWCLWKTSPALAEDDQVLKSLVLLWEASERRRCFRAVAASYFDSYSSNLPGLKPISESLARQSYRWGPPWDKLQRELKIFDAGAGPRLLARAAVKDDTTVADILGKLGCTAVGANSGLAQSAADEVLVALSEDTSGDHEGRLRRVQRFALRSDNRLLFPHQRALVARALLNPFDGRSPDKRTRDLFLRVVIALFGDPRLKSAAWNDIRDLEDMVRRWLTEQSLRQFLDIVDRIALEHMWRYRRAFWEAVYNANLISEAWVVFADDGARLARQKFGPEASFGRFGYGGAKPVETGHAVLLMRVGRGVVADWSHNGKCNIWSDAEAKAAPKLYKPTTYDSDEVRIGRSAGNYETKDLFSIQHMASDRYNWQYKVADRLNKMTGVKIPQSSYVVR